MLAVAIYIIIGGKKGGLEALETGDLEQKKVLRNKANRPSVNRYNAKVYQNITFRVRRDGSDGVTAETLKAAADREGQSVNSFILDAIRDKL